MSLACPKDYLNNDANHCPGTNHKTNKWLEQDWKMLITKTIIKIETVSPFRETWLCEHTYVAHLIVFTFSVTGWVDNIWLFSALKICPIALIFVIFSINPRLFDKGLNISPKSENFANLSGHTVYVLLRCGSPFLSVHHAQFYSYYILW